MDTVLYDFLLWHQLEEDPRLPARSFDQDRRVVFWIKDVLTAQPGEFCLVVGSDPVTVERCGPESGDGRGMTAVEDNIMKAGHGLNSATPAAL